MKLLFSELVLGGSLALVAAAPTSAAEFRVTEAFCHEMVENSAVLTDALKDLRGKISGEEFREFGFHDFYMAAWNFRMAMESCESGIPAGNPIPPPPGTTMAPTSHDWGNWNKR